MGTITHTHVSGIANDPTKDVSADAWNEGHTFSLAKGDVGLGNVDNTSDANKPISSATQTALDAKLATTTAASTYQPLDADLTAIAGLDATAGYLAKTAANTYARRTLTGTANAISVTNGDGTTGNPVFNIGSDVVTLTGSQVLSNKSLTAPALGTPASGNLSSCTADGTNAVGFLHIPQNSQSAAYGIVLADAGKHIYHPSADTTARTWTLPANGTIPMPVGSAVTFVNDTSGGVITIAITSDTLVLAGAGTTGSRSLAANGVATAIKVTTTRWIISGTGLT